MSPMPSKPCTKCREQKPLTDFNRNARASDGLQAYCRPCQKQYSDDYAATPKGKARLRASTNRHRTSGCGLLKDKARGIIAKRVANGELPRASDVVCAEASADCCGAHEWHHDSYRTKQDRRRVRSLCKHHHMKWHRENTATCPKRIYRDARGRVIA